MRLLIPVATCLLGIAVAATTTSAPNNSCVQAPYYSGNELDQIHDRYKVFLHPNYTLTEHFEKIGLNLTEIDGSNFRFFPKTDSYPLDEYHVYANSTLLNDIIRCDPGVQEVESSHIHGIHPGQPEESSERNQTKHSKNNLRPQAPLFLHNLKEVDPGIPDEYVVRLRGNHTQEEHFKAIGMNLSTLDGAFYRYQDGVNSYFIIANESLIHDLIRYDPWVKEVVPGFAAKMDFRTRPLSEEDMAKELWHQKDYEMKHNISFSKRISEWQREKRELKSPGDLSPTHSWERESVPGLWPNRMIEASEKIDAATVIWPYPRINRIAEGGKGVNVYIIDSGIEISHPRFEGRAKNWGGLDSQDPAPFYPMETMADTFGHGTFMAGIVGRSVDGIAPSANLINVKTGYDYFRVVEGIKAVTEEHIENLANPPEGWRGSVINLAVGGPTTSGGELLPEMIQALKNAYEAGIPISTAAGNALDNASQHWPCMFGPYVVCAGAVDTNYDLWDDCSSNYYAYGDPYFCEAGTNYGKDIQIYAPGANIRSTTTARVGMSSQWSDMVEGNGTSASAAYVTGVMALIVGQEGPKFDRIQRGRHEPFVLKVRSILFSNAIQDVVSGYKRPDLVGKYQVVQGRPKIPGPQSGSKSLLESTNNVFLSTGINNPEKDEEDPYFIRNEWDNAERVAPTTVVSVFPTFTEPLTLPLKTILPRNSLIDSFGLDNSDPNLALDDLAMNIDLGPRPEPELPLCVGNQVHGSCVAGQFPWVSVTPYSGFVPPACYKAAGDPGNFPRINITQASRAATQFCQKLIKDETVLTGQDNRAIFYKVSEVAENKSDMTLAVSYDLAACPKDMETEILDFKAIGQERCWENAFYEISQVCAQTPQWAKFNPECTLEGGILGSDCGMWSLSSGELDERLGLGNKEHGNTPTTTYSTASPTTTGISPATL